LNPVYLSARSAIVKPERALPMTIYALNKWLPRLGPERWSLVQLLRGLCFEADRRTDGTKRVTTSWKSLGELLQVHEETIASWLKHEPIPDDKPWRRIIAADDYADYLSIFIPRLRYAYETRQGKTRRVGFLLEVLMEDPVAPEDEVRLAQQVDLMRYEQSQLGLTIQAEPQVFNPAQNDLPGLSDGSINNVTTSNLDLPNQRQLEQDRLTSPSVNRNNIDLPPSVKQHYVDSLVDVSKDSSNSPYGKSDQTRDNVNELKLLLKQLKQLKQHKRNYLQILEPVITLTENLLDDYHSTAMLYKVLKVLFPDYTDIYVLAVEQALSAEADGQVVNKGAVFVRVVRQLAEGAHVDLGFKSSEEPAVGPLLTLAGSPSPAVTSETPLRNASVEEAIWAEVLHQLRGQMTKGAYDSVMQKTRLLSVSETRCIIQVATPSAKEWLENRWRFVVERVLSSVIGSQVEIIFQL